jgi:hypothetical protein
VSAIVERIRPARGEPELPQHIEADVEPEPISAKRALTVSEISDPAPVATTTRWPVPVVAPVAAFQVALVTATGTELASSTSHMVPSPRLTALP